MVLSTNNKLKNTMKYKVVFTGRISDSIGITYQITDTVMSEDVAEALYSGATGSGNAYEHISIIKIKKMPSAVSLNVAGELIDVLFDGKRVTSPEFPDQEMEFTARCGHKITQENLVEICRRKLEGGAQ